MRPATLLRITFSRPAQQGGLAWLSYWQAAQCSRKDSDLPFVDQIPITATQTVRLGNLSFLPTRKWRCSPNTVLGQAETRPGMYTVGPTSTPGPASCISALSRFSHKMPAVWLTTAWTATPCRDPPLVDLRALLQAGQQADDEGLETGQEQPLQWQEVLLIQAQKHGPHRHGRMRQEWEEPTALGRREKVSETHSEVPAGPAGI